MIIIIKKKKREKTVPNLSGKKGFATVLLNWQNVVATLLKSVQFNEKDQLKMAFSEMTHGWKKT